MDRLESIAIGCRVNSAVGKILLNGREEPRLEGVLHGPRPRRGSDSSVGRMRGAETADEVLRRQHV